MIIMNELFCGNSWVWIFDCTVSRSSYDCPSQGREIPVELHSEDGVIHTQALSLGNTKLTLYMLRYFRKPTTSVTELEAKTGVPLASPAGIIHTPVTQSAVTDTASVPGLPVTEESSWAGPEADDSEFVIRLAPDKKSNHTSKLYWLMEITDDQI